MFVGAQNWQILSTVTSHSTPLHETLFLVKSVEQIQSHHICITPLHPTWLTSWHPPDHSSTWQTNWLILYLTGSQPGHQAQSLGAALALSKLGNHQPLCLFDTWPTFLTTSLADWPTESLPGSQTDTLPDYLIHYLADWQTGCSYSNRRGHSIENFNCILY